MPNPNGLFGLYGFGLWISIWEVLIQIIYLGNLNKEGFGFDPNPTPNPNVVIQTQLKFSLLIRIKGWFIQPVKNFINILLTANQIPKKKNKKKKS